jgi:hypothetical protein
MSSPSTGAWNSELYGVGLCPTCWTAWGRDGQRVFSFPFFFSPTFLGLMGLLLQVGALMWSHQVTGLWAVFGSFCPQVRLLLGPQVTHCQFMQGIQSCCFTRKQLCCPTAATVSGWLLPQPHGAIQFWVLPSVSWDQLREVWEVCLSPHPHSQPLCLASPLLCASSAPLGDCLVTPHLLSAFVTAPTFVHWEFDSLPHSCSPEQVQHSTLPLLSVLDCNSLFMLFSFLTVHFKEDLHY